MSGLRRRALALCVGAVALASAQAAPELGIEVPAPLRVRGEEVIE